MKNSFTKILVATAIALLSAASPVHSAALSFFPTGTQLDSDAINDIAANVGDQLPVTLQLDTTGLTNSLQSFTYVLTRNTSALSLVRAHL